jgi:hypothetical protein
MALQDVPHVWIVRPQWQWNVQIVERYLEAVSGDVIAEELGRRDGYCIVPAHHRVKWRLAGSARS